MAGTNEAARHQALEDIGSLRDQGWYWSETTPGLLLSPGDRDVFLRHDAGTGVLTYSPKVIAMMRQIFKEDQDGAPPP
jgi:hypothetical protein